MNIKMTDTQNLLLQGILALLGGALLGAVEATLQYVTQNGTLNLTNALVFALTTFLALAGKALYGYVPAHVAQEVQAGKELSSSLQNVIANLNSPNVQPIVATPVPVSSPIQGPLVVVNHPAVGNSSAVENAYNQAIQVEQPSHGHAAIPEQHAASSPVLDFPENAFAQPTTAANTLTAPPVQQIAFPAQQVAQHIPFADQDTLTTMQVARAKAGML